MNKESFNWAEPPARFTRIPIQPFVGKMPMSNYYVDSVGQAFEFNPADRQHPFTYRFTLSTERHEK